MGKGPIKDNNITVNHVEDTKTVNKTQEVVSSKTKEAWLLTILVEECNKIVIWWEETLCSKRHRWVLSTSRKTTRPNCVDISKRMVFAITELDVVTPMENMSCVNHKIKEEMETPKSLTTRIRCLLPKTCTTWTKWLWATWDNFRIWWCRQINSNTTLTLKVCLLIPCKCRWCSRTPTKIKTLHRHKT